jgi:hypothetical protein
MNPSFSRFVHTCVRSEVQVLGGQWAVLAVHICESQPSHRVRQLICGPSVRFV